MSAATSNDAAPASARTLGILLLLAGLVLLVWPAATPRVLASWVGVGAVAHGVRELTRTFAGDGVRIEFSAGLLGLISVFGGVVIVVTPFVSEAASSTVIGIYWLIAGLFEASALLRPPARLERLLVGVISLGAGGLVLMLPSTSLVVVVWLSGGWLLSAGAIMLLMDSLASGRRRAVA